MEIKNIENYRTIYYNSKSAATNIRYNNRWKNGQLLLKNRTISYTLSTICDIIDVSNKLHKNLTVISLDFLNTFDRDYWDFVFSALQKFGYGDKFVHIIKVSLTNIQSEIKINSLISDWSFHPCARSSRGVSSCYTLLQLRCLPISLIRIKVIQIEDYEIKIVNFDDNITIILRYITGYIIILTGYKEF